MTHQKMVEFSDKCLLKPLGMTQEESCILDPHLLSC